MISTCNSCAEPLFVDPYAGCFVAPNAQMDMKQSSDHYCLGTKFIDDKLLRTVNHIDGLKQVVFVCLEIRFNFIDLFLSILKFRWYSS